MAVCKLRNQHSFTFSLFALILESVCLPDVHAFLYWSDNNLVAMDYDKARRNIRYCSMISRFSIREDATSGKLSFKNEDSRFIALICWRIVVRARYRMVMETAVFVSLRIFSWKIPWKFILRMLCVGLLRTQNGSLSISQTSFSISVFSSFLEFGHKVAILQVLSSCIFV